MVSDIKELTGQSAGASQGLWSFVGSLTSWIEMVHRCHLASQRLTFEMCWKRKPRPSREVCDNPLVVSTVGSGGGRGATANPEQMLGSLIYLLRVFNLTSSPRGLWGPQK